MSRQQRRHEAFTRAWANAQRRFRNATFSGFTWTEGMSRRNARKIARQMAKNAASSHQRHLRVWPWMAVRKVEEDDESEATNGMGQRSV